MIDSSCDEFYETPENMAFNWRADGGQHLDIYWVYNAKINFALNNI